MTYMKPATFIARVVVPLLFLTVSSGAFAQTATMTTSGNWNVATNWSGSNIGDALSEAVVVNNSINPTIPTGLSYTVGSVVLSQDNSFDIDASSTLTVGSSGAPGNFTTNLNPSITIVGGSTLEIWGNFIANNNVTLNITGTIHIHGNLQFSGSGTNATINGTGNLIVDGNMTGSGNVNFNDNGHAEVFGSVNVGGGSNLNGSGVFVVHGSCSGTPFCSSGILPVDLLYFKSRSTTTNVDLVWATASETAVDYFTIEKSVDGKMFSEIAKVTATGDSQTERMYSYTDEKPAAGLSFFRLNEITRDGFKRTLATIRNNFDASKEVAIYPNPGIKDQPLSFSLNFNATERHEISVFDMRGVLMGKAVMEGNEASIPLQLGTGVYIVKIVSSEFSSVQKVVIQ
jgi:hypothetical protein